MLSIVFAQIVNNATGATPLFRLNDVVANILTVLLPLGGVILFVMLLVGGIYFVTSGPDPKRAQAAKNTITYAIIGVIVLALAFLIISLIASFTGSSLLEQFNIYVN